MDGFIKFKYYKYFYNLIYWLKNVDNKSKLKFIEMGYLS